MSVATDVTRDEHGDVVMTVTLRGGYDAMRFAHGMLFMQCEFADQGRYAQRRIRRLIGSRNHDQAMTVMGMTAAMGYRLRRALAGESS